MIDYLNQILQLPEKCIVNKNLSKVFFKRNFDLTPVDRKLLEDSSVFSSMTIVASIKTSNSNIPSFCDDQMNYVELLVIAIKTNTIDFEKNYKRISDLVQKYIPYPILITVYCDTMLSFSLCEKRINRNEPQKRTIERNYYSDPILIDYPEIIHKNFLESLSFSKLHKGNMKQLFESYLSCIIAIQRSELVEEFQIRNYERSIKDVQNLEKIKTLQLEIVTLQNQIKNETQLSNLIRLNDQVKQMKQQIQQLEKIIKS